jgi:hypothetical protein
MFPPLQHGADCYSISPHQYQLNAAPQLGQRGIQRNALDGRQRHKAGGELLGGGELASAHVDVCHRFDEICATSELEP